MAGQFDLDQRDLKKLIDFYKVAPRLFERTSAGVLNGLAFETMPEQRKQLGRAMIIRTPALLKHGLRVKKASATAPISQQFSQVGSIDIPRHDDWKAAETGEATRATMFTTAGRGGSKQNVSKKAARAGQFHTEMDDFNNLSGSGEKKAKQYLQAISSDKERRRKPFYMPYKFRRMGRGVYKFKGGRVGTYSKGDVKIRKTLVGARIRRLSKPAGQFKPRKIEWNETASRRIATTGNIKKLWVNNFNHIITPRLKK